MNEEVTKAFGNAGRVHLLVDRSSDFQEDSPGRLDHERLPHLLGQWSFPDFGTLAPPMSSVIFDARCARDKRPSASLRA